jgi:transcriptional regulator of arginine metabolism
MIGKLQRQAILVEMISSGKLSSQAQAVENLLKLGIDATQATISRDFEELGVVREHTKDGHRYILRGEANKFGGSLVKVFREYVIKIAKSGNLIVLHTPPGHASIVAAALDRSELPDVLGVIAGDDTIFVCVAEETDPLSLIEWFKKLS